AALLEGVSHEQGWPPRARQGGPRGDPYPKKTLKALEKIQRGFLWAGRAEANGGNCHVNW
uniref:Uncharacterized protein n=1 Tax=Aegilops tauschii subsp. strangulata TaxID=200361 RepID=A0A453SHE8_AEGTS